MKRLVLDIDNTIAMKADNYEDCQPNLAVIEKIREYKSLGFEIVLYSARNMRTYEGNIGKINANTLPVLVAWLEKHDVPYDEIWMGKPWCGTEGFYVDDRAIRPNEFATLTQDEIHELIKKDSSI